MDIFKYSFQLGSNFGDTIPKYNWLKIEIVGKISILKLDIQYSVPGWGGGSGY